MNILNMLQGKRTYLIGGLIIAGALFILLTPKTIADVPETAWVILSGLGLAAVRAGIDSVSQNDNKGWKTYLAAAAITILGIVKITGVSLPEDVYNSVLAALEGIGLIGIRAALEKIK